MVPRPTTRNARRKPISLGSDTETSVMTLGAITLMDTVFDRQLAYASLDH